MHRFRPPERNSLPQSAIFNPSSRHFFKALLTKAEDDTEETKRRREGNEKIALEHIAKCQNSPVTKLNNEIADWETRFETDAKAVLLQPFSPIVVAADENERIRIWNYEQATLLNGFDNHDFPDKGISKLCLVNELDDSLLLVASSDGDIRIWKDYTLNGKQNLVTAFSSIPKTPAVRGLNAVVDWQQQSGFLYSSGEVSSIYLWDLNQEQCVNAFSSSSDYGISALSAFQVEGCQLAAGFMDGSVRFYDVRTPLMLVCATQPHMQVGRVVGIGFELGLNQAKIVSASQAGDIKFLDTRNCRDAYRTINAHNGSLTAFAVHRHAPIIASGSAEQGIKVFSLEGEKVGTIKFLNRTSFMPPKIGSVSCLAFHPYQVLLAAGSAGGHVSIYEEDNLQAR